MQSIVEDCKCADSSGTREFFQPEKESTLFRALNWERETVENGVRFRDKKGKSVRGGDVTGAWFFILFECYRPFLSVILR